MSKPQEMQSYIKAEKAPHSLAHTLEQVLQNTSASGPTIEELTRAVGDKGFGVLLMLLSLPSALPIPAPGYSIPFGIAMAIIAIQIMVGRESVWLPRRILKTRVPPKLADKMVGAGAAFLRRIERLIKPRMKWMHSKGGHALLAVIILLMSLFMMIPIPGTNTLPAMAIFIIGVSMAEKDGFIAVAALLCAILAAGLSGTLVYVSITRGPEAVEDVKDWIKGFIRMPSD
ncbi:MAG: exopolysaccharide biosynthesis protein [Lentimonas sp.]